MWTSEQVNDLLTSLDSNSHHHDNNSNNNSNNSGPHSPLDSNYTYASADPTAAPHVVLSPSWTLPRRAGGAEQNPLASLQQYQANNPLPDVAGLNMLSSPGLSDSMHSPMLAPTDMAGMLLSQSPPIYSHQPFASASSQSQSMPFSAPANSFEFDHHLDFYPQQQQQQQQQPNVLLQPDASGQQRQSSWPLSPPPLSTPSPVPQFSRAGTQPPEGLSVETSQTFGRRRSISMSGMELQAAAAAAASSVAATHVASSGPVRPRPSRNRSASNLSHHRPTAHNQRPPTGPDSLYTVPRSPSAKERRAVASKRRATLQSVVSGTHSCLVLVRWQNRHAEQQGRRSPMLSCHQRLLLLRQPRRQCLAFNSSRMTSCSHKHFSPRLAFLLCQARQAAAPLQPLAAPPSPWSKPWMLWPRRRATLKKALALPGTVTLATSLLPMCTS